MSKKILVLILLFMFLLSGCTGVKQSDSYSTPAAQLPQTASTSSNNTAGVGEEKVAGAGMERIEICMVHNMKDHPSIAAIWQGFTDEAKIYNVGLTDFDPNFDPQKQAAQIDDCIARKPNVIFVNVVDPAAVVASLKKAQDAGIPVITINADTNEEGKQYRKMFIGIDSVAHGYLMGLEACKDLNGQGKLVLIHGKAGQTDEVNRHEGWQKAMNECGGKFELVAEQFANWDQNTAMGIMQDILTKNPKIDVVYVEDDGMALGVVQAFKAAGRDKEAKVYASGLYQAACCDAVYTGDITAEALQSSYFMGYMGIRFAYDIVHGRVLPPELLSPSLTVTKENIQQQCVSPGWTPPVK